MCYQGTGHLKADKVVGKNQKAMTANGRHCTKLSQPNRRWAGHRPSGGLNHATISEHDNGATSLRSGYETDEKQKNFTISNVSAFHPALPARKPISNRLPLTGHLKGGCGGFVGCFKLGNGVDFVWFNGLQVA